MPDTPIFRNSHPSAPLRGGTLFERMQRGSEAPSAPPFADPVRVVSPSITGSQNLVVVDQPAGCSDGHIRFERAEMEGKPGIVMQQRQDDGDWQEIWSLPTQSVDAREGMVGWLNTQNHRWDRFARMLQRRGPDELTSWIFELMVQPTATAARPPRVQSAAWVTIDQYDSPQFQQATRPRAHARVDNCVCRRNPRDF